jgi:predicted transcriptional regulator
MKYSPEQKQLIIDYIIQHYATSTGGQMARELGIPEGTVANLVADLVSQGKLVPKGMGNRTLRAPQEEEQEHTCPPHHRLCGRRDIQTVFPDFYLTHELPAPGFEDQVCKHCGDVLTVQIYKPTAYDAGIERVVEKARDQQFVTAVIASNGHAVGTILPPPRDLVFDGDSGDEQPEPVKLVDIPGSPAQEPLVEAVTFDADDQLQSAWREIAVLQSTCRRLEGQLGEVEAENSDLKKELHKARGRLRLVEIDRQIDRLSEEREDLVEQFGL